MQVTTKFFVVESHGPAIVDLPSSEQLELVTLHCEITNSEKVTNMEDLIKL